MDLIDGRDVERLNNQELRKVLNSLLKAEAALRHISLSDLDLTTRDTDPDAGIDGRIKWPNENHELLRKGENVVQYKSGKLSVRDLSIEFKKPGVQSALKLKGNYLLLVGQDYVRKDVIRLQKALKNLCRRREIPATRAKLIFGSGIARWISRHPAVVALPELRQNIIDFVNVSRWRRDNRQLSNPFLPDESRTATIMHIREFLDSTSGDSLLRVEGPAGVGKTRLVLEAVSLEKYEVRTLYALSAENREVQPFLSAIYSHEEKSAVVVLDECDITQQNVLKQYSDNSNGRLKLICVGPSDVLHDSPPLSLTQTYRLAPLPDVNIEAIVRGAYTSSPAELVDASVRLSGGYVKLALFIAAVLDKSGIQAPLKLKDVPDIRQFLLRFVDKGIRKSLQVLSLLARVGWEEELRDEARGIAKFVGLDFSDLESAVVALQNQGVVIPRGRYLYVSPDLLAIEAAADLWDEKGSALIDLVLQLQPAPRRQLLRRLVLMGEHLQVRKAVSKILSKNGLYPSLKELDEPFLAEVFRFFSAVLPVLAAELAGELILPASTDELKDFRTGRREVLWSAESLLRWPETSLQAARIVMKLAINENEDLGNNATAMLHTFFQIFLSGSPLPLMERFVLIDELIADGEPVSRLLAVNVLSATLQLNESRAGGETDPLSAKPFPPEWRPKLNSDIWEVRRKALTYLERLAQGGDEAASNARVVRLNSVRALLQYGQVEDAIEVLDRAKPQNDKERRAILDSCNVVAEIQNLPAGLRDRTIQVSQSVFGDSYFGRLRRWVGTRLHNDFDGKGESGYAEADKRVEQLAEEAFRNGISEAEISWLVSREAEHAAVFGFKLGELDQTGKFFAQIVLHTPNDINCLCLASYIRGQALRSSPEVREALIDKVAEEKPEAAFGATWRNEPTSAGVDRIIRLASNALLDVSALRILLYGAWSTKLSANDIIKLIKLMLKEKSDANLESVLGMIDQSVRSKAISVAQFGELIWKAVEAKSKRRSPNFDWRWAQVASLVAANNPRRLARIFVSFFDSDDTWLDTTSAQEVLGVASAHGPADVWEVIGAALLKEDLTALRLGLKLQHWFGEIVPVEVLLNWALQNGERAFLIAANLLNAKGESLSERARLLVRNAPEPERILERLSVGLRSGGFWGPISARMERDLATLEKWTHDKEPKIRNWAQAELVRAKKGIQRQKLLEEEQEI
jgi:hypothetical protein